MATTKPFITISIQTYNNASLLSDTLRSLTQLQKPVNKDFEILVIDNNSRDGTCLVLQDFEQLSSPKFRYVFEPNQGLSYARNRAITEAKGEVIAFIDDDVIVEPDWLIRHLEPYIEFPSVDAVGGKVELKFPRSFTRPSWFSKEIEAFLSGFDMGNKPRPFKVTEYPFGCNMSVRRELALSIGGFSTKLGRSGKNMISNEEKLFFYKLHQQKKNIQYQPFSVVHHVINMNRLTKKYFIGRGFEQGISNVLLENELNSRWRPLSLFISLLRGVFRATCSSIHFLYQHLRGSKEKAFYHRVYIMYGLGILRGIAKRKN